MQVPDEVARTITLADPATRRDQTPIKLTFDVASIDVVRATIADSGGRVEGGEWEFGGQRHCDFVDLEGNVGQLCGPSRVDPM